MALKTKIPKKVKDKYTPAPMPSDEEIDQVLSRIKETKHGRAAELDRQPVSVDRELAVDMVP